jgi:hypothetical protein
MSMTDATTLRTAIAQARVTALGGSATCKLYNGTKPASLGTPGGTLLATLTFGATAVTDANGGTAGSVTAGVLTLGGITQTNTSHVAGTPTFARFSTSGGTALMDIDIGSGAGNLQFTGAVANGQNVTATGLTITAGNP